MTEQQMQLVKRSWIIFQKIDPVLIGDVFYEKLFTDHPSFRRLFISSRETQSKKIIAMLNSIVNHIETLDQLSVELKQLAIQHVQYGVKPEYYSYVKAALLWMLQQGSGNDWTREVEEAWAACYHAVSTIMMEASEIA